MEIEGSTFIYLAIFAALLVSLFWRSARGGDAMIAIAGIIGAAYGYAEHGIYAVLLPLLVALFGGVQAGRGLLGSQRARFARHEQPLRKGPFAKLDRATARHLIDQGVWIEAKAGDLLAREGEPITHLHWIAEGSADVVVDDEPAGKCGPRSFVGEATVFSGEPASGTVRLAGNARLWSVEAEDLRAYADDHPEVRQILDQGFTQSLAGKLDAKNRAGAAS
ncbi:MAG: cyclic nucleotide-binding domain-containing protein [Pseudomonadota bacterium]|nr:cyclic nucleotide-binding domain-containing protein [Pseudomonadota bacterium]